MGGDQRVYDEQLFKLTGLLGETMADLKNYNEKLEDTNKKLDNLCKNCGPGKTIKDVKKWARTMKTTVAVQLIILGFVLLKEKIKLWWLGLG
jgi:hypothetical protein